MGGRTGRKQNSDEWKRRWKEETAWKASELAKLCCGWNPDSDVLPDPAAYNHAMETILRAVRVGDIQTIDLRVPASREEFFYGDVPLFRPSEVCAWAAKRFPGFPYMDTLARDGSESDTPADASATQKLRERRYARIDAYQKQNGIPTRRVLCEHLGMGRDTFGGIVRGEKKKFGASQRTKLLSVLGLSESDWNRLS